MPQKLGGYWHVTGKRQRLVRVSECVSPTRTLRGNSAVQAPHPPLRRYYENARDRSTWVRGVFDRSARDYDRLEALVGLGTGSWYRRRALRSAGLKRGMTVVDVGTGTGLLARAAAQIIGDGAQVTGVDPSPGMLEHAKVPAGVRLLSGSAERIPVADSCADFLCMGYALRHLNDLSTAFAEFYRVVRPGGRLCVLEMTLPTSTLQRAILKTWLGGLVPRIARVVGGRGDGPLLMRYHWDTIAACVPPDTILRALHEAGFEDIEHQVELAIFSAYNARKPG
jgi:demethylmenaquinone methyltransferase/2-methoxy-6-polyprenyl-1,4-benzoquinol methylase